MTHKPRLQRRSAAEWISAAIALLVVLAVLGALLYQWKTQPRGLPHLAVYQDGEVWEKEGSFYLPVTVLNKGGHTADEVTVRAELQAPGQPADELEQTFQFLSSGESERGVFVFSSDPRRAPLRLRVISYRVP